MLSSYAGCNGNGWGWLHAQLRCVHARSSDLEIPRPGRSASQHHHERDTPHQHHHQKTPKHSWSIKAQVKARWMQSATIQDSRDGKVELWVPSAALQFYSLVSYSADPILLFSVTLRGLEQGRQGQDRLAVNSHGFISSS